MFLNTAIAACLLFYCIFTSCNITTINCTPASTFLAPLLLLIFIHTTCISLSLRRTSAPIHLTSVLGVLGTQETSCIVIAGLLERDIFDLFLPEFDKPWVIHLRETCCCSTNLCSWRPNTVYKNRSSRRHQALFWRRCRGGKVKGTHTLVPGNSTFLAPLCLCSKLFPLDPAIASFCFLFTLVWHNGQE